MVDKSAEARAAWVLNLDPQLQAAVGEREMVHLLESPRLVDVPHTPFYCRQVVLWNETVLAALDLAAWLQGAPVVRTNPLAGILAYQEQAGGPVQYGALLLSAIPVRLWVTDDQACALPEEPGGWAEVAISCFSTAGRPVPILDVPYLYSGGLLQG